jgi:hypothetical protein
VVGFLLWKGDYLPMGTWQFWNTSTTTTPRIEEEKVSTSTPVVSTDTQIDENVELPVDNSRNTFNDKHFYFSYPKILNGHAVSPKTRADGTVILYESMEGGATVGVLTLSRTAVPSQASDTNAFRLKDASDKSVRLYFDTEKKSWVSVSNIVTKSGEKILSWSEAMSYFLKASTVPELQNIGLVSFSGRNAYAYYQPTEANIFGYRVFDQKQANFADIGFVTALPGGLSLLPKTTLNEVGYLASEVARTLSLKL